VERRVKIDVRQNRLKLLKLRTKVSHFGVGLRLISQGGGCKNRA